MLYYFEKGKNTTEMHKRLVRCMEKVLTDGTCQKWFSKFCAGDFLLDYTPWLGRPFKVDSDQIKTLTENNQSYTMSEIFDIFKISKSSTENHLYQLGYANCFDVWVPHKQQQQIFLTIFPNVILYLNITKMFPLKTDFDKQRKMDTVQ